MALINFKRGSFAEYAAATKSADTLYFVTDEHRIYMGEVPYSGGIYKEVAALPATGEINTIYKVTDTFEGSAVNGDVAYWDGTKYVYLVDMSDIQAALDAAQSTADDAWARTLRVQVSSAPADAAGDTSALTATVWRGGEPLSDETVAKMGLLAWYVGGSRVATGGTYTCAAGTATECRLEA